jgi:GntR family transcriptional regulator
MQTSIGTTKYRAVRDELLARVSRMPVGERLPSEAELCDEYAVSRITLRKAVDGLVQAGWLAREHGRGTFVTEPRTAQRYPEQFADVVTGFHTQQTRAGNTVTTRVLRQELQPADARLAGLLQIDQGARVVELVRLRFVNGQLHQHVKTWLPHERYPDVYDGDFSDQSLYAFLQSRYGVALVRNDLVVRVADASPEVALNLGVETGMRLLTIDSLVYDTGGAPVAFGTARHTPENSEIFLNLHTPHEGAETRTTRFAD